MKNPTKMDDYRHFRRPLYCLFNERFPLTKQPVGTSTDFSVADLHGKSLKSIRFEFVHSPLTIMYWMIIYNNIYIYIIIII